MALATSYKAIDPIVFSVTGAYRFSRRYGHAGDTRRNGNLLMLAPSVGFAVNEQAHAGEAAVRTTTSPQPMAAFSQQDINGLFDQADMPMQLVALLRLNFQAQHPIPTEVLPCHRTEPIPT